MQEVWRPVVGWETRYEVSSQGRVRSLACMVPNAKGGGWHERKGRILKPTVNMNGYAMVGLRDRGRTQTVAIHSIVTKAFHGPSPGPIGLAAGCWTVDHKDCDKLNNAADNLRWLTAAENKRLACSSLTEDIVRKIRLRRTQGECGRDLAREHGISESAVCLIFKRKTWGWVT
jgi:hypothetical protein